MKYTARYFKESLPEWKRKKDSVLVRHIIRPISFHVASVMANLGITSNQVSFFSMLIALISGALFLITGKAFHVAGSMTVVLWMILDCTDGNLARSVKQQNYGEFADGMSGYFLVNWLFLCLGMCAYRDGGVIVSQNYVWIMFIGALAASFDSLSRLANQKFINTEHELIEQGRIKIEKSSSNPLGDNRMAKVLFRIIRETNLNGLFLPLLLLASVFNFMDLFVIFYAIEYCAMFAGTLFTLIRKVLKENKLRGGNEQ